MTWQQRYQQAHEINFSEKYPTAYMDNHYSKPVFPKVLKANGLTLAIVNYLTWSGWYANRINVQGRLIDGVEKQPSGVVLGVKKWLPSATKKGTADLHCLISGKHVSIEVKIGADKMSTWQHEEQARIERAGGYYWVVKTIDQFFELYDGMAKV